MHPMRLRPSLALAAIVVAMTLAGCGSENDTASDTGTDPGAGESSAAATPTGVECDYPEDGMGAAKPVDPPPTDATVSGEVPVTLTTTIGDLAATLDADTTPCTVNSFVSLAEQGYFDGVTCHRMTTAGIYVLQCGDPTGTGSGGPGYSFGDELSGSETYGAGTLAMANAGPDTNGSQFFIVYADTQLSPAYTVFGQVDPAAVKAVKKVAKDGVDDANGPGDGHPLTEVTIDSVSVG